MRCWHKDLIPVLPRQQLLGQWRECCLIARNIAKKGTPKHILVNRIMDYSLNHFAVYTAKVITEMQRRNYKVVPERFWGWMAATNWVHPMYICNGSLFDDWHNDTYLRQCLYNLEEKAMCGGITKNEWQLIYDEFKNFTPLWKE